MANKFGNNGGREYSFLNRPVWIDCAFTVDVANVNGLGVKNVIGNGVRNVFLHTSATPGSNAGMLNPNPAVGYGIVQLRSNYNKYAGGFNATIAPTTGSAVAINSTALTANKPYVVNTVGVGPTGTATIAPVADSAGSLASTWFSLFDSYGNTFIIWFSVSGVGKAPAGVSGTLVQQTISSGATAAQIGTALVLTIQGLPSGIAGVNSFTASGTTTVTAVSTKTGAVLPGVPQDGLIPTGFTFALTKFGSNTNAWQQVGLWKGLDPVVGQSFVAANTGYATGGGSSGTVLAVGVSGISSIELVGDPNATLAPGPQGGSPHSGGFIMFQFLAPTINTGAFVTPFVASAVADNSIVRLGFYVEAGSILLNGE